MIKNSYLTGRGRLNTFKTCKDVWQTLETNCKFGITIDEIFL